MKLMLSFTTAPNRKIVTNNYRNRESRTNRAGRAGFERAAAWWQERGAAHAAGTRAQQARKLETRALFAGSQSGTVPPAGQDLRSAICATRSKGPRGPAAG
jgi:hypothetical protein